MTEAHGTIDAHVIVLVLPAAVVRGLLPAGLELAPQPVVPHGWHPVFFMCASDHFGAWFGDLDYQELMVGVPWVQICDPGAGYPGPFIYMPRLYLNHAVAREFGVRIYGWEKRAATIEVASAGPRTTYTVTAEDAAAPTVTARFDEVPGSAARGPADIANFTIVRQLFEQPTISQARHVVDADSFSAASTGPFLATTLLLQVDRPGTTVQPIEAELVIGPSLTPPGIPAGTYKSASLDECELGAFRLQCQQFVSLPGPCARVQFPRPPPLRRLKIAVLGGGPAACAAALYLARQKDRYEVSLYSTGYRLGGKCQSWRDPDKAWRIEEHGLHAFLGFYHNAFTAVHDAYRDAFPDGGLGEAMYSRAFLPGEHNGLMVAHDGRWTYCSTPGSVTAVSVPGVAKDGGPEEEGSRLAVARAFMRLVTHIAAIEARHPRFARILRGIKREVSALHGELLSLLGKVAEAGVFQRRGLVDRAGGRGLSWVREAAARLLRSKRRMSTDLWFLWTGIDTLLTIIIGLLRHPVRHLDELDGVDFRVWLRANGLHEAGDERWAVIDQVYETLFAHQPADPTRGPGAQLDAAVRPDLLACGVATRWFLLQSFGERGAPSFRFSYSCAQTMITPYYLALRQLGAKIHFFHTVTGLEIEGEGPQRRLTAVRLVRQAEVAAGSAEYQPLLTEDLPNNPEGLRDWPKDPHWDQLVDGAWFRDHGIDFFDAWRSEANTRATPVSLEQGVDFDLCVLGVPLGALPLVDSPLTACARPDADPRWKAMIDGMAVAQTLSCQLWLTAPPSALFAGPRGLLTAFAQPQPSYGDFTPLLAYETWAEPRPQSVAYFTGAAVVGKPLLPPAGGAGYPAEVHTAWTEQFRGWLGTHHAAFFDGSGAPSHFEGLLELLAVEGETSTPSRRLDWQHFVADVQPSSLYVLSQPGSTALRLGQAESGVKGLLLCGDWTRTDLNCGCVEAATSSGMLAARAISNEPRTLWRPGF
ncbi:MAG: NAD(P)-binding protein [Nannocystis sp.]|nr:NAD(P)-binding protein [Nannocystis sp.]MBA3549774.1 NAD(P)-binding protein [Nannocystis sp.]